MSIWPHAMSYSRPSSEVDFVSPVIACLDAVYGAEFARGTCAEIEPLLIMRPPRGVWPFMTRNACCVHRKAPVRFVSSTSRHFSYAMSSIGTSGALTPARSEERRVGKECRCLWLRSKLG